MGLYSLPNGKRCQGGRQCREMRRARYVWSSDLRTDATARGARAGVGWGTAEEARAVVTVVATGAVEMVVAVM